MKTEDLTAAIARYDPLLADAVGKMVGYIQDRWAAPYPSKEQTEAVNAYLRSVHADGDGTMSENNIAHRRIATQKITISAIRVLDHEQLDRLQDVHLSPTHRQRTSRQHGYEGGAFCVRFHTVQMRQER